MIPITIVTIMYTTSTTIISATTLVLLGRTKPPGDYNPIFDGTVFSQTWNLCSFLCISPFINYMTLRDSHSDDASKVYANPHLSEIDVFDFLKQETNSLQDLLYRLYPLFDALRDRKFKEFTRYELLIMEIVCPHPWQISLTIRFYFWEELFSIKSRNINLTFGQIIVLVESADAK